VSFRVRACAALALATARAGACPCSDDAGSFASLVRRDERYAAALVATSRSALGRFDALGRYAALAAGERETSEELLLRVGVRLPERVEGLAELGYSSYRFNTFSARQRQDGVGDALGHVRYRLLDEAMPHAGWPWPSLALGALVRAPLGALARDRAASFGSGGAQRGLGAWELGGGLELARSLSPELELSLGGEAAYRFEDHVLGPARRLGPRVDLALGARALPASWLGASLALRVRATGDVSLSGRRLDGTSERLWTVVAGANFYDAWSRLRSAVTLSVDPPLPGLSRGSTAAVALGVSLGLGGG
jgi:hypothetical protein